jgi:hypothetical protein
MKGKRCLIGQPIHGTFPPAPVSTTSMTLTSRWRRILRIAAFTVGVLLLGTVASVRIQRQILRRQAEHLLADIKELELGKSTWSDAQKIMTRWGAWGHYDGSCTQERCSYKIILPGLEYPPSFRRPVEALAMFATRDAYIEADLEVIDGVVWGKDFAVLLDVVEGVFRHDEGYGLLASARTVWRTAEFNRYVSSDHPDYVVGHPGGCEGCEAVYSRFTPFVAPSELRDLMDFNLDCLTRLLQCRDQVDIMPRVWRQVQLEERQLDVARKVNHDYRPPTPSPEFLGRDRANVVIAEVVSTRTEERSSGSATYTTFRLDQRLKHATFWEPQQLEEEYSLPDLTSVGKGDESRLIAPGRKVILAFDTPYEMSRQHPIDLGDYETLALTDENLSAVREGILLDIFPAADHRFP